MATAGADRAGRRRRSTARCAASSYVPGGETCRERGCPVAFGGCATRHCPRCGYTMPDEERSTAARFVRLLFGAKRASAPARPWRTCRPAPRPSIDRLEGDPALLARLTAQGLAPGVEIHVLQRTPPT